MIALKKQVRLYWPFAKSVIQRMLSYRLNFFMFVFSGVLRTFIMYYLWKAIFLNSSQSSLAGFTMSEMILYIFISDITSMLASSFPDEVIGEEVKQGSIAINLVRPINYQVRLLFESLGDNIYTFITVVIPLWLGLVGVRFFMAGEFPPPIQTFLLYALSTLLSFIIFFFFNFCFGMLSFYTTNIWGLSFVKYMIKVFFSGQLIPIAFFPLWAQTLVNFLPFSSMNYTPVMIYLGKSKGIHLIKALGIQIFWALLLFLLCQWLWNKAIKKLTILGG